MVEAKRFAMLLLIGICVTASDVGTACADDVADFYKSKRVRMIVGYGVGGGYDILARIVAKHLPGHIPGNPGMVVENRPGAGSLIAAAAIYNTEPKDGTAIGTFTAGLVLQQAMGESVRFDGNKFNWLASGEDSYSACVVRSDSGVRTIDDAKKTEIVMASQGSGNFTYALPLFLNGMLGTKFRVISGYQSVPDMFRAIVNNEVGGICIGWLPVILGTQAQLLEGEPPLVRPILVLGNARRDQKYLETVPGTEELTRTDKSQMLFHTMHLSQQITFPYATAPEVPADRVKALRAAFDGLFRDPEFVADANRAGHPVTPHSGVEVTHIVSSLLATPQPIIEKLRPALGQQ